MRAFALLLPLLCAPAQAGPKLKDMLPLKPVLSDEERLDFDTAAPSGVAYAGPAMVDYPVIPLQVFGLRYGADVVLVSRHPDWDMHEYARIDLPERSFWVAKDANRERVQTIVSDLPDLESWVPEVPIVRLPRPIHVDDRSEGEVIDIALAYTSSAGDPVTVHYRGKMARKPPARRNGATMGHSRNLGAVVLDLARFRHGGEAKVEIAGRRWPLERLLGFYPQKYLLEQAQGGIVITRFLTEPAPGGFRLVRPGDDRPWPTRSDERWTVSAPDPDGLVRASHDNGVTALSYLFRDGELVRAEVRQAGVPEPVFRLLLDPALPDLRRRFEGVATSRFALDIGGGRGHGTGLARAFWEGEHAVVEVIPTEHEDLATRPMRGVVRALGEGRVRVEMERVGGGAGGPPSEP